MVSYRACNIILGGLGVLAALLPLAALIPLALLALPVTVTLTGGKKR